LPDSIARIAFTPGEPAGIGPDLCLSLAGQSLNTELVVICDPELLEERAAKLHIPFRYRLFDPAVPARSSPGEICVLPVPLQTNARCGQPDPVNARYVLDTLDQAISGCQSGDFAALVTGPVHKGVINDAGITFSGHTEYLAAATHTPDVVMLLANEDLRVALATTHVPLSEVSRCITRDSLTRVIRVLHRGLQSRFNIEQPCIFVCGLNPHAGEGGHLGHEEIDTLIPVLEALRKEGMNLVGPHSADTIFSADNIANSDAILAMYHDQGLPVLKHSGFGRTVNITLGLPIIRTSVDHGTALQLAGSGHADPGSLVMAIRYAEEMVQRK
jgi:4-hydroxythreonine-4-phosphate dehydrogenase